MQEFQLFLFDYLLVLNFLYQFLLFYQIQEVQINNHHIFWLFVKILYGQCEGYQKSHQQLRLFSFLI